LSARACLNVFFSGISRSFRAGSEPAAM
jgi:hypothetical protein